MKKNIMPTAASPLSRYSRGFTLVELMVSITLGLLVTAAAIQLFVGNIMTTRMQQANDELQNSGVFGVDYMTKHIRLANYGNISNPELNEQTIWGGIVLTARTASTSTANLPIPTAAPYISSGLLSHSVGTGESVSSTLNEWQGFSNVNQASDQLTIQFVAPTPMVNCEGAAVQMGDRVVQRYFLRRDPATATAGTDYALACDANTPTPSGTAPVIEPATLTGFGDAGQVIVPRVDYLTFQLGTLDSTGNIAYYTINQYRTAANTARTATPARTPPKIVAVKIGVIVRSMDETKSTDIDLTKPFSVFNQSVTLNSGSKTQARRVYTTTVALRDGLGDKI